jgi:hypothetical protein
MPVDVARKRRSERKVSRLAAEGLVERERNRVSRGGVSDRISITRITIPV